MSPIWRHSSKKDYMIKEVSGQPNQNIFGVAKSEGLKCE